MAIISDAQFRALVVAGILAATLIAYANTFSNAFVWDDASSVLLHEDVKNARIGALFTKDQHAYGRGQGNFYRPLVSLSFAVDYALTTSGHEPSQTKFGVPDVSPFLFHVSNALWHAAAGILLFFLLAQFGAPRIVQACVPVLWVVHPLQTEAVAYISGRADPMAATFGFAGLLFALRSASTPRHIAYAILSTICIALALLCKESALIFPVLILAMVVAARLGASKADAKTPQNSRRPIPALIASAVVTGIYLALRATVLNFSPEQAAGNTPGFGQRLYESLQAFALYIRLIFIPTGLHMERTLADVGGLAALAGTLLLAACVGIAVWAVVTKRPRLWTAMAIFLLAWLPVSGIFPLNAPMAEHWMYVPLAGFLWALFELAAMALQSVRARTAIAVVAYAACLCFIGLTVVRNQDWRSNESIYVATLKDNPNSIRVTYNLAVTYQDLLDNIPGARRSYERVVDLYQNEKERGTGRKPRQEYLLGR